MRFSVRPRVRVVAAHRIDTDRLRLRSPAPGDAPEICRLLESPQVAHWLVRVPVPYRIEHAKAWIDRSEEERMAGIGWPFLITLQGSDLPIGSIDLSLESGAGTGFLGYWLGEDYWNLGYATEAIRAIIPFAFGIAGINRIAASTLPDNARSIRVLEKAGLRRIDSRSEDTLERGRVETEYFALERTDWRC
jgi:RimJ/RimL family protein N-acetyltransferase